MSTHPELPKVGPVDLVLYHVGGDDGVGPIGAVLEVIPNCVLVTFEIRDDARPVLVETSEQNPQQIKIKVNRAVDEKRTTKDFYVTNQPKSSSLFKPSPMAKSEDPGYPHCQSWDDTTQIVKTLSVQTSSIEQIINELGLPPPDIISSDAQGAELGILRGAGPYLDTALALVTEVEFSEIYHRQPLFDEQMALVSPKGFRLANILNAQMWHPMNRMKGMGFLTAAEALFVKYFFNFAATDERPARGYIDMRWVPTTVLLKAILVAMGFRLASYAVMIAKFIKAERNDYQQYVDSTYMLKRTFDILTFFEQHKNDADRSFDFFIDTLQIPDSVYLRNGVPDTCAIQRNLLKQMWLQQQAAAQPARA